MESSQKEVEEKIVHYIKKWDWLSKLTHFGICVLGISAVAGGLFVSVFLGFDNNIPQWLFKLSSFLSSISIALLTAFDMVNNKNKYRNAWRLLNAKYLTYKAGKINIYELINWYERSEEIIGNINFNYSSVKNGDKND
ncbi:MAG: hypothetical protein WC615_01480 [Mucilaginibacter sp.]|jgi:hypothetical protein|uniref:hypothetical protein n=1 Tax=Mucilaginibacter sp. TaxID=1882438 RepID=UPI003565C913